MADLNTTNYSFVKPEVGASEDTWGAKLNANWDSVDSELKSVSDDVATALAKNPTLTLSGDVTGTATFTNLGDATLVATIADDSHNHTVANIDGLQSSLDAKAPLANPSFSGAVNAGDSIVLGSWTIYESSGSLVFKYGSDDVFKIDLSGNITAQGNVTAYGTV